MIPYVWRIIWTVGRLMAVTAVLPSNTEHSALDAFAVFSTWYPVGVMQVVYALWPFLKPIDKHFIFPGISSRT